MGSALDSIERTDAGPLTVVSVPCLTDNFAYLMRDSSSGAVGVVDAPDAAPIVAALDALGWTATDLLLTHHHDDHVQGVETLRARTGARVTGAAQDAARLPRLDAAVSPGEALRFGALEMRVLDAPGHTVGHIAYHLPEPKVLFSGDTLFAMGCGRLFEGTAQQMWSALSAMAALPDDTQVFFGHEYTLANGDFALDVEPDNTALRERLKALVATIREGGRSTPTTIGLEKRTNPFLRAGDAAVAAAVGLDGADAATVFAELRRRKDRK